MPHGLGKSAVVAVYTTPDMATKAKEAGADIVVDSTVLNDVINLVCCYSGFIGDVDKEWCGQFREVPGYPRSRRQLEAFR